jgi:hypothetical protein
MKKYVGESRNANILAYLIDGERMGVSRGRGREREK